MYFACLAAHGSGAPLASQLGPSHACARLELGGGVVEDVDVGAEKLVWKDAPLDQGVAGEAGWRGELDELDVGGQAALAAKARLQHRAGWERHEPAVGDGLDLRCMRGTRGVRELFSI